MLVFLFLLTVVLVACGVSLFAALSAIVVKVAFVLVPVVFMFSLILGLGARNWGRCL